MSIVLGRVDYRLLHGIVATMWAPQSGAQRVMVIDDRTANDPIIKESMRLGKPAGMACSIITEETAMKNFKAGKYDDHCHTQWNCRRRKRMELSILQIVFITLIAYLKMTDTVTTQLFAFNTIICGWLTGLVVGDPTTGLSIGATMQLMSMGVVAVGGSSMPDYPIAAIIATTIAVTTGKGMEAGLAIGLPVAMLGVNFDVIYKIFNGFLMRKETSLIEEGKFQSALNMIKISPVFYGLCSAVPVLVCIVAGPTVVNAILDFMPAWFTTGLTIAGGVLPGVGMAMLLMYMPLGKYWSFLLVGFVLAAYLKVPVLGIAAIGLAGAYEIYKNQMKAGTAAAGAVAGGLEDE